MLFWPRSETSLHGRRVASNGKQSQRFDQSGNAEDFKKGEEASEPSGFRRFKWRRDNLFKLIKPRRSEGARGWKGSEGFQSKSPQNEKKAFTSCQKVHQGGGVSAGCERSDPLHLSRVQQEAQLGETKNPHANPLRIERTSSDVDARQDGEGCIDDGSALASYPSSFAGSRLLAGGKSDVSSCRPPRTSQVRGGGAAAGKHCVISEGYVGAREAQPSNGERRDRQPQRERQRKRWQEQKGRGHRAVTSQSDVQSNRHFEEGAIFDIISRQHGSFSRFMKLFYRPDLGAGASTLIHNETASVTLFPSKIPWCKPPSKSRVRRGSRSHKRVAFQWLKTLWGLFNFLEGGSPCSTAGAQHVAERASLGGWTAVHEDCALTMFKKLVKYVSHPRGAMERGTATLDQLIAKISLSRYDPAINFENGLNGALDVDPTRISLPEIAAVIDPRDHLTGERLRQFETMNNWVPKSCPAEFDQKPCHKVSVTDWPPLLKKLHSAKMIEFLPVEDVLHDGHRIIKGGLFCVPHKATSDRLINDRRPLNIREHRLDWCELPAGPMLTQLILDGDQSVRCSGDDLSNYFYLIKHLDCWLHRNCFGDPIMGHKLPELGLDPHKKYLPAFRVVCMGDTNGVDIAQGTHEAVLAGVGRLQSHQKLVYGKLFPASDTLEGLYIDDHLVFQVVPTKKLRQRRKAPDEHLILKPLGQGIESWVCQLQKRKQSTNLTSSKPGVLHWILNQEGLVPPLKNSSKSNSSHAFC